MKCSITTTQYSTMQCGIKPAWEKPVEEKLLNRGIRYDGIVMLNG